MGRKVLTKEEIKTAAKERKKFGDTRANIVAGLQQVGYNNSFSSGDRVRVVMIQDAGRCAGTGGCSKPPDRLIEKIGTIFRSLISWDGYWVRFGRGKKEEHWLFANYELKSVRRN